MGEGHAGSALMSKRIFVAVDLEERTRDVVVLGRLLRDTTGARTTLVTVFPYDPLRAPQDPELVRLREESRAMLLELGRAAGLDGSEARVVAAPFAARELQRLSEERDAGVLVVGSTKRGAVGRVLLGGVGQRLVTGAACPVAVAPRGYGEGGPRVLDRIGVGFDGSEEAERALDAGVALAEAAGATLRIISAFQRLAFGGIATGTLPGESVNAALRRELVEAHEESLERVRARVSVEGHFVDGPADEVLARESESLDLLVAGSRGYGPRTAVLLGSTTTALARSASCPLLLTPRGTAFDLLG
jgi:nucleotide-binding universal stress UspA family protein